MRAYLYHWSVLRCGIPVKEHRHGSTRLDHRVPARTAFTPEVLRIRQPARTRSALIELAT